MKEQIKLYATKSGKAVSKTINNVNPDASNMTLAEFGTKLNDLTSNTYERTDRVTTINCDSEPGGGAKPTPTITLNPATKTAAEAQSAMATNGLAQLASVTSNSTGRLYSYQKVKTDGNNNTILTTIDVGNKLQMFNNSKGVNMSPALAGQSIVVGVEETDEYAAGEVEFTFT